MRRNYWMYGAMGTVAALSAWVLFIGLPGWYPTSPLQDATVKQASTSVDVDFIEATLFYISDDGMALIGFDRRLARQTEQSAQARVILEAQLAEPPTPLLSPIPSGTQLLAFYLTEQGDAFVDLSEEVVSGHSGGSLEELFTVYAIVNAVTTNLPTIKAVQILVNGQEVDTLVGHVDLQRPLNRNMDWVTEPEETSTPQQSALQGVNQ